MLEERKVSRQSFDNLRQELRIRAKDLGISEDMSRAVFEILARLIELLAARGIIDRADVLEFAKIAKRHGRA